MRRFVWILPFLVVGACKGLFLEAGNAYPCDFSKGPGVRDEACIAGDVCGANDLCQKYLYEGPRFEGVATVPSFDGVQSDGGQAHFGPPGSEGAVLHPLVLDSPVKAIVRDLPLGAGPRDNIYVQMEGDVFVQVEKSGNVLSTELTLPSHPAALTPTLVQPFTGAGSALPQVLVQLSDGRLFVATAGDLSLPNPVRLGAGPFLADEVRFLDTAGPLRRSVPVAWNTTAFGFVAPATDGGSTWALAPVPGVDPSRLLDVAGLTHDQRQWVMTLSDDALTVTENASGTAIDAGVVALAALGGSNVHGTLRTDREGRIVAVVRRAAGTEVLSTFQVSIGADGLELSSPWPSCHPCARPGQQIQVLSASVATGVPVVEVVCSSVGTSPSAVRVVGSVALSQTDGCITETFDPPVPFSRFAANGPARWNNQTGLLLGGAHGEIWSGTTISGLRPTFLDRVPRDVAPMQTTGAPTLATITDDYLTALQTPDLLTDGGRINGFRRIDPREVAAPDDARLLGFVHDTPGWGIGSNGDVLKTVLLPGMATVRTGPRLVTASGLPIRDSIGGEAFVANDGGLQGFFVAADDSLYFVRDPRSFLTSPPMDVVSLAPDLTPEPSVPIRSLALERTPLGTDGVHIARGYLVTSRNVYSWQLAGTPARWSSTPVALAGGQPEEVWFDSRRSALGRVGFGDGAIYTLPGGYLLAEPLPADDDVPPQVLDYENLGGWPVAYATTGVFVAGWPQVDGKLQNHFPDGGLNRPMEWTELTLPDAGRPWMRPGRDAVPGKLFVAADPQVTAPEGSVTQTFRLLLFLDNQVLQIATHVRNTNR